MFINLTYRDKASDLIRYDCFPMGERNLAVSTDRDKSSCLIHAEWPFDVFSLALIVDAVRNTGCDNIDLFLPYLPFARQDRVCNPGEPHASKAFANFLNSLHLNSVTIIDPHSAASVDNIDGLRTVPQHHIAKQAVEILKPDYIVSPDKGARHKAARLAKIVDLPLVVCDKVRDPQTGKLSGFRIIEDQTVSNTGHGLIVDDICDAGGTFVGVHNALVQCGFKDEISLYITHGGFTKGLDNLKCFDKIVTTNSITRGPQFWESEPKSNKKKLIEIDIWEQS